MDGRTNLTLYRRRADCFI